MCEDVSLKNDLPDKAENNFVSAEGVSFFCLDIEARGWLLVMTKAFMKIAALILHFPLFLSPGKQLKQEALPQPHTRFAARGRE